MTEPEFVEPKMPDEGVLKHDGEDDEAPHHLKDRVEETQHLVGGMENDAVEKADDRTDLER